MKFIIASLATIAFAADIKDTLLNKQLDANKALQAEKREIGAKPLEMREERKVDNRADLRAVKREEAKKADITTAEVADKLINKDAEQRVGAVRSKLEEQKAIADKARKVEAKKLVQEAEEKKEAKIMDKQDEAKDLKNKELKTAESDSATNMPDGKSVPSQAQGSEMMGIGQFAGNVNFDNLFTAGPCPTVAEMQNIDFTKLSGDWFLQRTDEPSVPELLPSCHHANFNVNADGSFTASEEVRIEGKSFVSHDIKGMFKESTVEAELFGSKLRVQMQLIDTDYQNYLIGYQCYDNIEFAKEKKLEPVHIITVGIASRDRNVADADLQKWEAIAVEKVPDLKASDLAIIQSGDKGKCDYKVPFTTAK